jgi:predicted Zn-dependent protease
MNCMGGFFYNMGRAAGQKLRKGKWVWQTVGGTDEQIIAAELAVGRDLAAAMREQLGVDPSEKLQRGVRGIGDALAAHVKNRLRRFDFTVIEHPEPNAFALPGGFVMITRRLIDLLEGEPDEVAFVLGHEMGHVIKQDPMGRIMTDTALGAAMRVVPVAGAAGGWIKGQGMRLMQSAYSQDAEFLADRFGLSLSTVAGYDPEGGVRMLNRLWKISEPPEPIPLGEYFATHPPFATRIKRLQRVGSV